MCMCALQRVSIGVAMVSVPSVLYLDEPTSGLDSESAYEIMSLVRQTARDGTTVAMAIHAPSPELFAMFDSVLVFAQGCNVYSGPTGKHASLTRRIRTCALARGVCVCVCVLTRCVPGHAMQVVFSVTCSRQQLGPGWTQKQTCLQSEPCSQHTHAHTHTHTHTYRLHNLHHMSPSMKVHASMCWCVLMCP